MRSETVKNGKFIGSQERGDYQEIPGGARDKGARPSTRHAHRERLVYILGPSAAAPLTYMAATEAKPASRACLFTPCLGEDIYLHFLPFKDQCRIFFAIFHIIYLFIVNMIVVACFVGVSVIMIPLP